MIQENQNYQIVNNIDGVSNGQSNKNQLQQQNENSMKVQIKYDESQIQEYVLIEFQGKFEKDEENMQINYLPIGRIEIDAESKKAKIMSGIHDLTGNIVNMNEPILITEKRRDAEGKVNIIVKGICEKKLYFNTRPTPILERAKDAKKIKLNGANSIMGNN